MRPAVRDITEIIISAQHTTYRCYVPVQHAGLFALFMNSNRTSAARQRDNTIVDNEHLFLFSRVLHDDEFSIDRHNTVPWYKHATRSARKRHNASSNFRCALLILPVLVVRLLVPSAATRVEVYSQREWSLPVQSTDSALFCSLRTCTSTYLGQSTITERSVSFSYIIRSFFGILGKISSGSESSRSEFTYLYERYN